MESKSTFNINHIIISLVGGFALGAYIFGSKNNKIREKIENEISNFSKDNEIIKSIKEEESIIIKENIISALEKILSELKPEKKDEEN